MDRIETYKPALIAQKVPQFLQPEAKPYQQQGLVSTNVHDITKLRSLLKKKQAQEESLQTEPGSFAYLNDTVDENEATNDALLLRDIADGSNIEKYKAVERGALAPVKQTASIKGSSKGLKQQVEKELGKAATFLAREDPTLLKRQLPVNFNSGGEESSDEYELDIEGWKAYLSLEDKDRLRHFCRYDPFK